MRALFVNSLLVSVLVLFNFRDVSNKYQEAYRFDFDFELSDLINSVVISNETNESVLFTFDLNNRFPLSFEKSIAEILQIAHENITSPIVAAWLYVTRMTYHTTPITLDNWQHEPRLFLNSIGGGFCDDLSSVLVALWQQMGYEARVMLVEGHVVAEVKDSLDWHMFDPDLMVYYTDGKGRVLSVEELEEHSEIIAYPNLDIDSNLNPLLRSANYLTKDLAGFYASREDNKDITEWSLDYTPKSPTYFLPPISNFEIFHNKQSQQNAVIVTLSEKSKGNLSVPLVPIYVEGEVEFSIGKDQIKLEGNQYRFSEEEQMQDLKIKKVNSVSRIYYRLNPKLILFQDQNRISINSSHYLAVKTGSVGLEAMEDVEPDYLLDKYKKRHYQYLEYAQNIEDTEDITTYLLREYARFLSVDSKSSKEQRKMLLERFRTQLIDLAGRPPLTKENLQSHYPILIYGVLTSVRYNVYQQ